MEIVIKNLKVGYRKDYPTLQIDELTLSNRYKCVLVIGPNGSGKSTFLKALIQNVPYFSGEVIFSLDNNLIQNRVELIQNLGICIETGFAYNHLTIHENINLFHRIFPKKNIYYNQKLLETLSLTNFYDTMISKLSNGQKRRVNMFFSLLHNPRLVIFDEPTEFLDETSKDNLFNLIDFQINHFNTQFIFSTNNAHEFSIKNELKVLNISDFNYV